MTTNRLAGDAKRPTGFPLEPFAGRSYPTPCQHLRLTPSSLFPSSLFRCSPLTRLLLRLPFLPHWLPTLSSCTLWTWESFIRKGWPRFPNWTDATKKGLPTERFPLILGSKKAPTPLPRIKPRPKIGRRQQVGNRNRVTSPNKWAQGSRNLAEDSHSHLLG